MVRRPVIIHLRRLLPTAFARGRATYPDASRGQRSNGVRGRLVRGPGALLGLAPGGVCRAAPVTWDAGGLLHRRFTLTTVAGGGLFSVALSRGSPRVGVTHHPALWSPDFPQLPLRSPGRLVRAPAYGQTRRRSSRVRPTRASSAPGRNTVASTRRSSEPLQMKPSSSGHHGGFIAG